MEIRLFLFPFFWFFAAHQALGEVTTQGGLKSNVVAPELTCQETFKRNSCQDQIDKAGGNRNDFLDCSKKPSILNSTTTCSAHLALGAGVSALTLAAPAVVLPVVGGLVTYNALRSEEVCFHDLEYKKKVVRPLAALHSVEYADALAKRLPCAELERLVVSSIKVHSGQIFEKEQNQQRFDKELARRPDQKAHLERIYPAQNRLLTANEIEFKTVLEQIKSEETQLISLVEKINKNFKCASFEKKVKFFCEILGGGSVGGLKLFSTARVKPSAKQKDLSRHSESSKQHSSLATDVVPLAIGQKVNIAGKTVSVREVLGDGEEAFVFLVQDSKGSFFALKAFNRPGDLKENRMVLDKMRTYLGDDSVVGIVGVSEARGHLLLEYVKGRELSEFLIDPNLSPQVKMRAQILFEELQRKARRAREIEPVDINVFVRDKDSSLVVIDPY